MGLDSLQMEVFYHENQSNNSDHYFWSHLRIIDYTVEPNPEPYRELAQIIVYDSLGLPCILRVSTKTLE